MAVTQPKPVKRINFDASVDTLKEMDELMRTMHYSRQSTLMRALIHAEYLSVAGKEAEKEQQQQDPKEESAVLLNGMARLAQQLGPKAAIFDELIYFLMQNSEAEGVELPSGLWTHEIDEQKEGIDPNGHRVIARTKVARPANELQIPEILDAIRKYVKDRYGKMKYKQRSIPVSDEDIVSYGEYCRLRLLANPNGYTDLPELPPLEQKYQSHKQSTIVSTVSQDPNKEERCRRCGHQVKASEMKGDGVVGWQFCPSCYDLERAEYEAPTVKCVGCKIEYNSRFMHKVEEGGNMKYYCLECRPPIQEETKGPAKSIQVEEESD